MVKLGVRGGAELRKRVASVKKLKSSRYVCPQCGKKSVKRAGNSRWKCKSCKAEFAGGAYSLFTPSGESARRLMDNVRKGLSGARK